MRSYSMKFVPSLRSKGAKASPNMLCGELAAHGAYPADATLFRASANPCARGGYLIGLISNAVDLLYARSDRMGALPLDVPADLDPRERHSTIGIGRVDDIQLESIG